MEIFRIFGIVQKAVQVCTPVMEGGEEKTTVRHFHNPVPGAVSEAVLLGIIGEPCLGKFYRADGTENIIENFVGGVKELQIIRSR